MNICSTRNEVHEVTFKTGGADPGSGRPRTPSGTRRTTDEMFNKLQLLIIAYWADEYILECSKQRQQRCGVAEHERMMNVERWDAE